MEYIKLKDLCEKEERFIAPNDDAHIDYVDISSVDNKSKSLTKYDTYIFAESPSRARKRVKHGDVIVSTVRPNLNAVARFNIQTPHTPIASTGFCVLRHKSDVDPIYIYFFCISPNFVRQMVAKATGASYPAVSDTIVREAKLPKHTAEKRVRIVSTLSKAKEIIEHRRAQLAKLDELVKCRFVEMFGDPHTNPYSHPVRSLKEVALGKLSYGISASAVEYNGKVRYVRITDITENGSLGNDIKSPERVDDKYILRHGDILFARTGATVGKTFMYKSTYGEALYAGFLIRLRPNPNLVLPEYVYYYTKSSFYESFVQSTQRVVAQPNINAAEYGELQILLPPMSEQQSFVSFVQRIDKLRFISGRKRVLRPSCTNELALLPQIWYKGCDIRHYPICNRRTPPVELCHCDD